MQGDIDEVVLLLAYDRNVLEGVPAKAFRAACERLLEGVRAACPGIRAEMCRTGQMDEEQKAALIAAILAQNGGGAA